jgi:hypothetical protein
LGFTGRLLHYICAKYPKVYQKPKQAWNLLYKIFPEFSLKNDDKGNGNAAAVNEMKIDSSGVPPGPERATLPEEQAKTFRAWLKYFPNEDNLRQHSQHFILLMYDMLVFYKEKSDQEEKEHSDRLSGDRPGTGDTIHQRRKRGTKGEKFTMMPLQRGFQLKHVEFDNTCLAQALQYTKKRRLQEDPSCGDNCGYNVLIRDNYNEMKSVPFNNFTWETFKPHKDAIWRRFFDTAKLSTKTRKFANYITTDGYSCSVHLERPEVESPFPKKPQSSKWRKHHKHNMDEEDKEPNDWYNYKSTLMPYKRTSTSTSSNVS